MTDSLPESAATTGPGPVPGPVPGGNAVAPSRPRTRGSRGRTTAVVVSALVGGLLFHGGIGAAGVGIFAAGQAAVAASLTEARDEKIAADEAAAALAEQERLEAEAIAAQELAAANALADEQSRREAILVALEKAVHEDAVAQADAGYLEGPILEGVCFPGGDEPVESLLEVSDGALECMAVTETTADEYIGYTYTASIDWAAGTYTFELV